MEMRSIGSLSVSVIGIGCNQFGPSADEAATAAIVNAALDNGINFFDTADEYGPEGLSEEYLGRALAGRRDEAVIATKFGHHMDGDPLRGGASARWIVQAVDDSLKRLGTDHIDLYQQHFPDPDVTAEETMTALHQLVEDGKVREIGCCRLSADDLADRAALAAERGITRLVSAQNRLNLLRQEAVTELVPALERYDMVLLPFFPLASGMLTGKYKRGQPLPAGTRFAEHLDPAQAAHLIERDGARVEALEAWAVDHGHTMAELAIAWLASQPIVASVIAGATSPAQVASNAKAGEWRLSLPEVAEVAAVGLT
ncbi:MAG: aldo/keto reductase [Acidobacteria bacterium]|nr:aldo/keto reductase [Acidobacteriota bacterium]